ncbi:hypothetical protein BgiMline_013899 [Biomphalaria glabrata]
MQGVGLVSSGATALLKDVICISVQWRVNISPQYVDLQHQLLLLCVMSHEKLLKNSHVALAMLQRCAVTWNSVE